MFTRGDAEFWYQMIRHLKPRRIYEIGSGYSTLMARHAISALQKEDATYACSHVCVEPYEMDWLEQTGVTVLREKVETLGVEKFRELESGDVLFIDSSHIIRPEGDVLFEYLELLPSLAPGVVIHIHDIFTPRNYLSDWLESKTLFWNEQYLLEAFLSYNSNFEVMAAVNHLYHEHRGALQEVCPMLTDQSEPGSFYIRRVIPPVTKSVS
jgi:predicted O-methyltransferase YrrM